MTSEYVKPEDFPWFGARGFPKPNLTGDILLGEQVITSRGNTVHRVEFRDLDHMQSHLEAARPWEEWCNSGCAGRESWVHDGSTRKRTLEVWDKGIAPSQEIRREYEQLRDKVQAQFVSVDMRKCRAAKRKRVRSWAGGTVDIPRFLDSQRTGVPAPVFRGMSKRADRPVIRIGLNPSMSSGSIGVEFARIAAITACMCEQFESLGYGVEVVGISCGLWREGKKQRVALDGKRLSAKEAWKDCWCTPIVSLKRADDPMDAERILSMGQAATLRDLGFRSRYLCLGVNGSCAVPDMPDDVVEACDCDVVIERKWGRDDPGQTANRIAGKIQEILDED